MIRLLKIEYRKLRRHKGFWVMILFYLALLVFMIFGIPGLLDYLADKMNEPKIRIFKALVFNFPDIWQNIAYVSGLRVFIKVILGIIVIILITNEFNYNTIRLNIVNGLSRVDFLTAKVLLLAGFSLLSMIILFLSGLYLGFRHSVNTSISTVFSHLEYLPAYFLELFTYLLFCMMLAILLKRAGITFIIHFVYFIVEPILDYKLPDAIGPYLPWNAMNSLVISPNSSLIKVKTSALNFDFQEYIAIGDVAVCLAYAALFIFISHLILKKRDL